MGLQTGAVTHHSYQTFEAETLRQKCTSTTAWGWGGGQGVIKDN